MTTSEIITIVVVGVFSLIALLDRGMKQKRTDADALDKELINSLKTKAELQEERIKELETDHKASTALINQLKGENQMMKELLQGRDKATLDYQKTGLEAMAKIDKIFEVAITNSKNIETLTKTLTDHFSRIEKHYEAVDSKVLACLKITRRV